MKKMVCEICGSQFIKKENGVFVCQECGTEYSLEEAKGLLQEVESEGGKVVVSASNDKNEIKVVSENDKYILLKKLSIWASALEAIESFEELEFDATKPNIWIMSVVDYLSIESVFPDNYAQLYLNTTEYARCKPLGVEFAKHYIKKLELTESDIPSSVRAAYNSIKNDFTIKYNSTNFGTFTYKGQSYLDAYPNIYKATGNASSICFEANHEDLLQWAKDLIYLDEKETSAVYKCAVFSNSRTIVYNFSSLHNQMMEVKNKKEELYIDDYKAIIIPEINKRRREFAEVMIKAKEVVQIFDLPLQYRSFAAVVSIMNSILAGKADTWKEAVLLYDEEKFRDDLLQKFDVLDKSLANMTNSINNSIERLGTKLSSELSSISVSLGDLNLKVLESNRRLSKISLFTGLTMWNTL